MATFTLWPTLPPLEFPEPSATDPTTAAFDSLSMDAAALAGDLNRAFERVLAESPELKAAVEAARKENPASGHPEKDGGDTDGADSV